MRRLVLAGLTVALLAILPGDAARTPAIAYAASEACSGGARADTLMSTAKFDLSAATETETANASSLTFWGCWNRFPRTPPACQSVYVDQSTNKWYICGDCDEAGTPDPSGCYQVDPNVFPRGYWCS